MSALAKAPSSSLLSSLRSTTQPAVRLTVSPPRRSSQPCPCSALASSTSSSTAGPASDKPRSCCLNRDFQLGRLALSLTYNTQPHEQQRPATAAQVQDTRSKLGLLLETIASPAAAGAEGVGGVAPSLYSCWAQERRKF